MEHSNTLHWGLSDPIPYILEKNGVFLFVDVSFVPYRCGGHDIQRKLVIWCVSWEFQSHSTSYISTICYFSICAHIKIIMYPKVFQDSKTELLAPIWIVSWMNQHHWLVRFLCYIITWDLATKMETNYWLELWALLTSETRLYHISWLLAYDDLWAWTHVGQSPSYLHHSITSCSVGLIDGYCEGMHYLRNTLTILAILKNIYYVVSWAGL